MSSVHAGHQPLASHTGLEDEDASTHRGLCSICLYKGTSMENHVPWQTILHEVKDSRKNKHSHYIVNK